MTELRLVLVGGLPLSGKSTLGRQLQDLTGIHYCDVDGLRGEAFGLPTREEYEAQWADPEMGAKWSAERMKMGYRLLHDGAVEIALGSDQSLMVGATYSRKRSQEFAKELAKKHNATLKVVVCRLLNETREELERRMSRDKGSEFIHGCATWNDYVHIKERFEAPDETGVFPAKSIMVVDTTNPITPEQLEGIVTFIRS